jgi:hypothetical protein
LRWTAEQVLRHKWLEGPEDFDFDKETRGYMRSRATAQGGFSEAHPGLRGLADMIGFDVLDAMICGAWRDARLT